MLKEIVQDKANNFYFILKLNIKNKSDKNTWDE